MDNHCQVESAAFLRGAEHARRGRLQITTFKIGLPLRGKYSSFDDALLQVGGSYGAKTARWECIVLQEAPMEPGDSLIMHLAINRWLRWSQSRQLKCIVLPTGGSNGAKCKYKKQIVN